MSQRIVSHRESAAFRNVRGADTPAKNRRSARNASEWLWKPSRSALSVQAKHTSNDKPKLLLETLIHFVYRAMEMDNVDSDRESNSISLTHRIPEQKLSVSATISAAFPTSHDQVRVN